MEHDVPKKNQQNLWRLMLLELLIQDGFSPERKGDVEYASPCPACGGDDRFIIWTDSDRYWCRQCEASGDAIQYLKNFHNMGYRQASEAIGIPLPCRNKAENPQKQNSKPRKVIRPDLWRLRVTRLIEQANQHLLEDRSSLQWLESKRGITAETAKRFQLGWISKKLFFERWEFGLSDTDKKLFVPSGLVIPWQDVRVRIRRDEPSNCGRYYVVPGSKLDPLMIGNFYENTAVIVESELDAILISQESTRPLFVVALGSAQKKPDAALLEMLNLCPIVLVALDNDEAGASAARWWLDNLSNSFRTLSPLDYGKDLTDDYLNGLDLNVWLSVSVELCAEKING